MSEATEIVHWPGRIFSHARSIRKAESLGTRYGITVSSTPWPVGGICMNCENEAGKPKAAPLHREAKP